MKASSGLVLEDVDLEEMMLTLFNRHRLQLSPAGVPDGEILGRRGRGPGGERDKYLCYESYGGVRGVT